MPFKNKCTVIKMISRSSTWENHVAVHHNLECQIFFLVLIFLTCFNQSKSGRSRDRLRGQKTPGLWFWFIIRMEKSVRKTSSTSTIKKAGKWHVKPPVPKAGYYLHLSLGRLGRVSDYYVSLIFPTSKSAQPSHALPPEDLLLLLM